jgi:hypothetical protein
MQEAAGGGWVLIWLSPVAYFLFDVVFAVLLLTLVSLFLRARRRARPRKARPHE